MVSVDHFFNAQQIYRLRQEFNNHPATRFLIPSEAEWRAQKTHTSYGLKRMSRQCHGVAHYGPKWFADNFNTKMIPYTGVALTSRLVGQFIYCQELKLVDAICKTPGEHYNQTLPMYHRHSWLESESGVVWDLAWGAASSRTCLYFGIPIPDLVMRSKSRLNVIQFNRYKFAEKEHT